MNASHGLPCRHDHIRQANHQWHEQSTHRHRRARVEELPDDSCVLPTPGYRSMRVHEPSELDDVDLLLPYDLAHCANLPWKRAGEMKEGPGMKRGSCAMQLHGHDVDTRRAQPGKRVPCASWQENRHRDTAALQFAREQECLVMRPSVD